MRRIPKLAGNNEGMHPRLKSQTGNRPAATGRGKEASPIAKRVPESEKTSEQIENLLVDPLLVVTDGAPERAG